MSPGQFIQIAVGSGSDRKMAYFTLSSPPGGLRDGSVQVIFTAKADPLSLHKMDAGKQLYVSLPMGVGMPHETVTNSKGDLFLFTDSVQGYSAAKSLVEWDYFRAVSGNGANRTNHVVIYYALPTRNSLPYPERLSSWSVFGVNVHPLPGISIMEHMSNPTPLGRPRHNLSQDHAFALVASPDTYEALFCACLLLGFRRTAVHRHTPDTIQKEVLISAANFSSQKSSDRHNFSNYYSPDAREAVEEEIWRNWVNVRESMREEFERKWSAKSRMERDQFMDFKSKSQAWESWFAHNKNQWDQMAWDQEQWGKYWGSWKGSAGGGGSGDEYSSSKSSSSSSNGYSWSQQNSKEYWDWVGRGQRDTRKDSNSSSGSSGAWDHYGGEDAYSGGGSWGSKSGYEKRGYRYNYEETEEDKKNHANNNNWWSRNSRKSSSSSSSGRKNQWGNWSSRGRNEQKQRSGGGSVSRNFGDLDFYAVLGINSGASRADIKKAYRKKAMQHHPDLNPNQREAETKMKQIVVAWSILKDEGKRQKYDRYGASGGGF